MCNEIQIQMKKRIKYNSINKKCFRQINSAIDKNVAIYLCEMSKQCKYQTYKKSLILKTIALKSYIRVFLLLFVTCTGRVLQKAQLFRFSI